MSDKAVVTEVDVISERMKEPLGTIGIPVRDSVNTQTMLSFMSTDWPGQVDKLWARGSILALQRNHLVQRMRGDWILFIDDDMVWQSDAILRLLKTRDDLIGQGFEPDMLGALCFRRSAPHTPTLFFKHAAGPYNFMEEWEDDVVEVDATGMAFCLIQVSAFEKIADTEMPPYDVRVAGQRMPDFFRWHGSLGEDLRFCQDLKQAGGSIYVDTRVHIGHVAEKVVGHRDFLREVADRDPQAQADRTLLNKEMGLPTLTPSRARTKLYG